ncbi:hypothetical protein IFM89_019023 [Coptis chinensis]|uniref:Uncharacterized protein n=1 Tax=Coptis chinensis TaxID=261450 RepID=A0A835HCS7_9MAGN|nr:hypothetical protein IFM89_019023 [Coptis chinensis]
METEKSIWKKCENELTTYYTTENKSSQGHYLKALACTRSLIVNHSTSNETIIHILKILLQILNSTQHHFHHHHVLKLLHELALHHDVLSNVVLDNVYSYVLAHKDTSRLTTKALGVLVEDAKSSSSYELGEDLFRSLCLSPSVSVRSWVLGNARRFCVSPGILVSVMLVCTNDPFPNVRRAALEGLIGLRELEDVRKRGVIESCYDRAVELLLDNNEYVRSVAVRVVCEWGQILAALDSEVGNAEGFDAVFIQLCAIVRDMSVEVRTTAFGALGEMKLVSEDILLQTLSKKVIGVTKKRKISGLVTSKVVDLPPSNAAGVFVHGLEDEFHEVTFYCVFTFSVQSVKWYSCNLSVLLRCPYCLVLKVRTSASISLGKLTVFSGKFSENALSLLMDMLNDDMMSVQLQCLEIMYGMATSDRLKVQQTHMHLFLGTLVDSCSLIRCATRKILRLMKLTGVDMFKSVTNDLLTNLESYPEDEVEIFNVLFYIGRSHGKLALNFVMEVLQEIEPSSEGDLCFDKSRVAAILVLAIAASLSHEQHTKTIPIRIFTYAVPFLGRISPSLRDVISQDTLFAYLSHCSRSAHPPIAETFGQEEQIPSVDGHIPNQSIKDIIDQVSSSSQIICGTSGSQYQDNLLDLKHTILVPEYQPKLNSNQKEATSAIVFVLRTVAATWPLIKSGSIDEIQRTLRSCKDELVTISVEFNGSVGFLAFACQYLRVIKMLVKVCNHFLPPGKKSMVAELEELHILEIILLNCVLRLSKPEICCRRTTLKKLCATMSNLELLCEKGFIKLSDFARELKSFCQEESSGDDVSYGSIHLERLLELFSLKQFVYSEKIKHIKADLDVPGNDSENPLPFISGLPTAVTFQITLHNGLPKENLHIQGCMEWIVIGAPLFRFVFSEYEKEYGNRHLYSGEKIFLRLIQNLLILKDLEPNFQVRRSSSRKEPEAVPSRHLYRGGGRWMALFFVGRGSGGDFE